MSFRSISLGELIIDDERALAGVALYGRLKQALGRSTHRFLVPEAGARVSWDRVLFLNLTYWSEKMAADVLCDEHIPADVLAHIAWHDVLGRHLGRGAGAATGHPTGHPPGSPPSSPPSSPPGSPPGSPSARALFFAESIASAFDLYLVGRLLVTAPDSDFITTQVPLMAERAQEAGLAETAFEALMQEVSREPERAFEDMRALLLDVSSALFACRDAVGAERALGLFTGHRFEPLLHHYELSNWILYARAYGAGSPGSDPIVATADAALRGAPDALAWLAEHWIDADRVTDAGEPVTATPGTQ